jgi:3',5'-cyclic-AMP phosphodiesterase
MAIVSRKNFLNMACLTAAGFLLPKKVDAAPEGAFFLNSEKNKLRTLRIAHLTDIHVENSKVAQQGMALALQAVNKLADKPDFIINGGDAIMNKETLVREAFNDQWKIFHSTLGNENDLPIFHCIGNHDLYNWFLPGASHADAKRSAAEEYELSKSYYSFSKNGWLIVVLDSIHGRESIPGYFGKLDDEQFIWLRDLLKNTPANINVCIVSHIPILAVCTLFDGAIVAGNCWMVPDNNLHADAGSIRDLFYKNKSVRACLSGHIHLIDHVNYLGVDYYCNGAVCGAWWQGSLQQFAPSFSVINLYDDGSSDREVHYYNWKT